MTPPYTVWHPNTQMGEWDGWDRIVRGEGMWLVDSEGHRMMDAVASMWCNVWGHSEPQLVEALIQQAETLQHSPLFNLTHEPAERLAGYLAGICPGMEGVFYSDNGSTAMEAAIKMAVQYWGNQGSPERNQLVGLQNGYHGDTIGAMSVGYSPGFFGRFEGMVAGYDQLAMPPAGAEPELWDRYLGRMAERLEEDGTLAALVMESGAQVAGGAIIYPDGFQSSISEICRRTETLLVADEVATGLGRLGGMAEYARQSSKPDIVAYGKMLTGGYLPMAATLATGRVQDAFLGSFGEKRHLFHGHTFTGNPLASAVAARNLELYQERRLIERVGVTSKRMGELLGDVSSIGAVKEVRHSGMLAGIVLDESWSPPGGASANRFIYQIGRRNGVYLRTLDNIILVVPPLAISEEDLAEMISRVVATIGDIQPLAG